MDSDWKPLFATVRRIYFAAIGFVGVTALTGVRIQLSNSDALLHPADSFSWAIRIALAVLVAVDVVTLEFVVRSKRASSDRPRQAWLSGPPAAQKLAGDAILSAAFCVAPVVYGVLLVVLGGRWLDPLVFALASALLLGWKFPRERKWRTAMVDEAEGGTPKPLT